MRAIFLLSAALALTGCATTGDDDAQPIPDGADIARSVVLCQTTIAELRDRLGPPSRDGRLGTTRVLTWVVAWDPLVQFLGVMADDAGTVVDVYWNLPSEIQWAPANRCK